MYGKEQGRLPGKAYRRSVLLIGMGIAAGAAAQGDDSLNVDMSECIGLESELARFACYEERVKAALEEREPATVVETEAVVAAPAPTPAPEPVSVPAPAPEPVPEPEPLIVESAPEPEPAQPYAAATALPASEVTEAAIPAQPVEAENRPAPDEIFATITALRETIPNTLIITLDNGQVWQQTQAKRYPLRVGSEVRLYSTRWGSSYRLTDPDRGSFITVRLVR